MDGNYSLNQNLLLKMKKKLLIIATFILWLASYNVAFSQGESCETPIELFAGGEYTADNSNGDQWFLFVPTVNGTIGVSTCDLTTVDTYIYVYENSCTSSSLSSDDACSSQSRIYLNVNANDSIKIRFSDQYTSSSYPFQFLFEQGTTGGESCDNAVALADQGEYFFDKVTSNSTIYYQYTVQNDGILNITDKSQSNTIYLYETCSGSYVSYSYNGDLQLEVQAGDSYILKWSNDYSRPFYWQIAEYEALNGGTCENAIPLTTTGTQQFNRTVYGSHLFYTYTASSDVVLEITDNDATNNVILRTDCGNYSEESNSNGDIEYYLQAGETIIIEWVNISEQAFTWNFTARTITTGDNCQNPIIATEGSNLVAKTLENSFTYFAYTPTSSGVIEIYTDSGDNINSDFSVSTNCQILSSISDINFLKIECVANQTYYITWENEDEESFNWYLDERTIETGDFCSIAQEISTLGTYTFNQTNDGSYKYYTFTLTEEKRVIISDTNNYNNIFLYDDCDASAIAESNDGELSEPLIPGTYIVKWETDMNEPFEWTIETTAVLDGEVCSIPLTAELGINHADNSHGDQWFLFVAPRTGLVTFSTCGLTTEDTYINLVEANCGELIESSDDDCGLRAEVTFGMTANDSVLIKWKDRYTTDTFSFSIQIEDVELGTYCNMPIAINNAGTYTADNSNGNQYFSFIAPTSGSVTVSTCNLTQEDTKIYLYLNNCSNEVDYSDDYCSGQSSVTTQVSAGDEVLIEFNDQYTHTQFDFSLAFESIDCNSGQTITEGTLSANTLSENQLFSYTATQTGKLIISSCNQTSLNTEVIVYNSNCQIIARSDNYCNSQSYVELQVTAGEAINILWTNLHEGGNFNWTLGYDTDVDTDNDGVVNASDDFPNDPTETIDTDSDGIGNNADTDDDGDGYADINDDFPLNSFEHVDTDNDGAGDNSDIDDDGDGVADLADAFPLDPTETIDTDNDGIGNNADDDDDGDGVTDARDAFPLDPTEDTDTDRDGIGNNADTDDDNDGLVDSVDPNPLVPEQGTEIYADALNVYIGPNPTSELLFYSVEGLNLKSIAIADLKGAMVVQLDIENQTSSIDISNLAQGLYKISFIAEEQTIVKSFVKK